MTGMKMTILANKLYYVHGHYFNNMKDALVDFNKRGG